MNHDPQSFRDELAALHPRQLEILCLIAKGYETVEIADRMCASVHTVSWHRKTMLKKLKCNMAEAIVTAVKAGYV